MSGTRKLKEAARRLALMMAPVVKRSAMWVRHWQARPHDRLSTSNSGELWVRLSSLDRYYPPICDVLGCVVTTWAMSYRRLFSAMWR